MYLTKIQNTYRKTTFQTNTIKKEQKLRSGKKITTNFHIEYDKIWSCFYRAPKISKNVVVVKAF